MDRYGICAEPRILFIDAYDSFANNIVALLRESLAAHVTTIRIDDPNFPSGRPDDFNLFLDCFDAVVAGPGPGTVTNPRDTGLIARLWTLPDKHLLPVLGICLGFQSLAHAFGATVERLPEPRHGIITRVQHRARSLFTSLNDVHATQYHSLHVRLGSQAINTSPEPPRGLWTHTDKCPDLTPLAWDCDSAENGPVLMAVEHKSKPFWGVQYHPESICTDSEGSKIIQNWWAEAQAWLSTNRVNRKLFPRRTTPREFSTIGDGTLRGTSYSGSLAWDHLYALLFHQSLINSAASGVNYECLSSADCDVRRICELLHVSENEAVLLESGLNHRKTPIRAETGSKSVIGCFDKHGPLRIEYYVEQRELQLCVGERILHKENGTDFWPFLKDFMRAVRVTDGPSDSPFWGGLVGFISYEAGLDTIEVKTMPTAGQTGLPWKFRRPDCILTFVTRSVVVDHVSRQIYVQSVRNKDSEWVRQTALAITAKTADHQTDFNHPELLSPLRSSIITIPAQSSYEDKVLSCQESIRAGDSYELCLTSQTTVLLPPTVRVPSFPWQLYKRLRKLNPAPFGAYLRLGPKGLGVNIISSSPERFLSWTREGKCQYRPIKGTVRKEPGLTRQDAEQILNSSKERAENLMIVDLVRHDLHGVVGPGNVRVSKLMGVEEYETVYQLVSVIEGDLTGQWGRSLQNHQTDISAAGAGAAIDDPTSSEEDSDSEPSPYSTKATSSSTSSITSSPIASPAPQISASHPLNSSTPSLPRAVAAADRRRRNHRQDQRASDAASGSSSSSSSSNNGASANKTGIDILHASLPPGSMTGAPKKRSCELLHAIEQREPRGIYSGVLGYLDVGGGGDFAVVIRTAFKWDRERALVGGNGGAEEEYDVWRVGAGGAVTAQSTPRGEYEEMKVKLESALRVFDADVEVDVDG